MPVAIRFDLLCRMIADPALNVPASDPTDPAEAVRLNFAERRLSHPVQATRKFRSCRRSRK